jgi:hypothetical protein
VEDDPCVGIYARKTILAHKLAQLLAYPFPINLHKSFNTNASIFNFGAPITRKCANLGVSWRNYWRNTDAIIPSPPTMARPSTEHYDLTELEKRDLIKLIEQGKPLPEKYRFMLFADKREVELVWNGKTREVCTAILPFQTLEHIDEPRSVGVSPTSSSFQPDLLDTSGRQTKGWTNKLISNSAPPNRQ